MDMTTPGKKLLGPVAGSIAAFASLVGAFAIAAFVPGASWAWALSAGALVLFCAMLGVAISGRPAGLIIDNRNRVSLSKFQAAAWTILVLSALMAATLMRVRLGIADPVAIDISGELLAVMGISATSLVATPVVLSLKSGEPAPSGQSALTAAKLGDDPANLSSVGKVYARSDPSGAQWLDMFRGEEVSNAASPDLSKLQQFLITAVVLIAYAAALWSMFAGNAHLKSGAVDPAYLGKLPVFSPNMVWLIGISHAGYLAYKAAPHGRTDDTSSAPVAPAPPDGAAG